MIEMILAVYSENRQGLECVKSLGKGIEVSWGNKIIFSKLVVLYSIL